MRSSSGASRERRVVDLDLHPSVLRFGKGEPVADDGLRARRGARQPREQQDDDGRTEPTTSATNCKFRLPASADSRRLVGFRPSACAMNAGSGRAPSTSVSPLTTVFGTADTRNRRARSGNSVASTANAVMCGLANAISCASMTARGQCGQVGVVNTCSVIGRSQPAPLGRGLPRRDRMDGRRRRAGRPGSGR